VVVDISQGSGGICECDTTEFATIAKNSSREEAPQVVGSNRVCAGIYDQSIEHFLEGKRRVGVHCQ